MVATSGSVRRRLGVGSVTAPSASLAAPVVALTVCRRFPFTVIALTISRQSFSFPCIIHSLPRRRAQTSPPPPVTTSFSAPAEQLTQCGQFPEAFAHTCINTQSSFVRQGLQKNTRYTLSLSVVNPGGAGPRGPQSSIFKTATSFPEKMPAPTGETISRFVTYDETLHPTHPTAYSLHPKP